MHCSVCRRAGASYQCARCKTAVYCSRYCQRLDWTRGGHPGSCSNRARIGVRVKPSPKSTPERAKKKWILAPNVGAIWVKAVLVKNPIAAFTDPISLEIVFETKWRLPEDLEWTVTYVGSADSPEYDQKLASVVSGSGDPGFYKVNLDARPPDAQLIPPKDLLRVTVLLISGKYRGAEFIRVGYFVSTSVPGVDIDWDQLTQAETASEIRERDRLLADLAQQTDAKDIERVIIAEDPKVNRFAIAWWD